MAKIKLIVGLGNPGKQYADTRHNVGQWLVEQLAAESNEALNQENKFFGLIGRVNTAKFDCRLLIPTTFMNLSGQAVAAVATFYKIFPEEILVVHDELDLPAGAVKLKQGGGHGGHNGLRSIISCLAGNKDFKRLRLGIGHPGNKNAVTNYVLHKPGKTEENLILDAINEALCVLPDVISGNMQIAMNNLHTEDK